MFLRLPKRPFAPAASTIQPIDRRVWTAASVYVRAECRIPTPRGEPMATQDLTDMRIPETIPPDGEKVEAHLMHCIWVSAAVAQFGEAELRALLEGTRRRNAQRDITGMLLFDGSTFFQVMEGEDGTVGRLFDRIAVDPRHHRVIKLIHEPIATRDFTSWSMGFAHITMAQLRDAPGLNDFFRGCSTLIELKPGWARRLLEEFRAGRWRVRLD